MAPSLERLSFLHASHASQLSKNCHKIYIALFIIHVYTSWISAPSIRLQSIDNFCTLSNTRAQILIPIIKFTFGQLYVILTEYSLTQIFILTINFAFGTALMSFLLNTRTQKFTFATAFKPMEWQVVDTHAAQWQLGWSFKNAPSLLL